MRGRRRAAGLGAFLGALVLPAAVVILELRRVGDPVLLVGLITASAAINSLWPLGGGMLAAGTYRSRFLRFEWTHDTDRSIAEAFTAGLLMGSVTAGSFFLFLPLLGELWLRLPSPPPPTVLTWSALAALIAVTVLRYRPEHRLYEWRRILDEGIAPDPEQTARWTKALQSIARADGSIGHLGGIGALTVGLHEHLDAERILRALAGPGDAQQARQLQARALDYLATCALPEGGFPAYPGGDARLEHTARAIDALGARLTEAQLAAHRAFAERCRRGSDFARSVNADAEPDQRRWGEALLR